MSFNYTPPPEEIIEAGTYWTHVMWASALLIPNVKAGAVVVGLSSGVLAAWVTGHAKGDMGGVTQMIETPFYTALGAAIGAALSFCSLSACRFIGAQLPKRNASGPIPEPGPDEEAS